MVPVTMVQDGDSGDSSNYDDFIDFGDSSNSCDSSDSGDSSGLCDLET